MGQFRPYGYQADLTARLVQTQGFFCLCRLQRYEEERETGLLFAYGKTCRPRSKQRNSANTKFFTGTQNQMKRRDLHPWDYLGCPPFLERTKCKRQASSKGCLPCYRPYALITRACSSSNLLKAQSNHSATVAVIFTK